MKKVKKLFLFMVLSIFLVGFANTTEAAKVTYSEKPTIGIPAEDLSRSSSFGSKAYKNADNGVSSLNIISEEGPFIASWGCDITNSSSSVVRGYGQTVANTTVSSLAYVIYLQQWDGYKWVDMANVGNSDNFNISVEGYHYFSATKGKYYRLNTYHSLNDNGYSDFETSTSPYIYIQ